MTELVHEISSNGWLIAVLLVGFMTFCGMIKSIVRAVESERTKREIAAYIAEGSMTREEGERLVRAKPGIRSSCDG